MDPELIPALVPERIPELIWEQIPGQGARGLRVLGTINHMLEFHVVDAGMN